MTATAGRRRVPSRSTEYRRAVRLVARWAAFYTRDLDPRVAGERRDELASDLWEQGADADARGASGATTEMSILWRAARGIPADLSWRRARASRRQLAAGPESRGWSGRGSAVVAVVIAALVLVVGATAVGRLVPNALRGALLPSSVTMASLAVGCALLVCALVLMTRTTTRWLGAAWVAVVAPAVLTFGGRALADISATFQWYSDSMVAFGPSWWGIAWAALLCALSLFYLALAVAWFPSRETEASR